MNIPYIIDFKEKEYEEFLNDITTDVFIFLGAGFSKQVGYKTWEELTKKIIDNFWDLKLKNSIKNAEKLT